MERDYMATPEYHFTHKGYIMLPCFDVHILDPEKFSGGGCDVSHWSEFKTFIFKTFFAPFWNGKVIVKM
jgi:hypothetical protein